MKENLTKHLESFNPILETKILSEAECKSVANRVIGRSKEWENRSPIGDFFMSYGALTYLDAKKGISLDPEYDRFRGDNKFKSYEDKAKHFNILLFTDFYWVYDKIKAYYQEKFTKQVIYKRALPGFHIFQNHEKLNTEEIKNTATIHIDAPHTSHNWEESVLCASSFTLAIKLPKCGAGLNIWRDDSIFNNIETVFYEQMSKEDQIKVKEMAEYFPYKLGYIYEQSGMLRHQITVGGQVLYNERRITLQGHLVETKNEVIIYV